MNILITICARAGSKGLPGKHLRNMNGKPLIQWTFNQAREFSVFLKKAGHTCYVVVNSDDRVVLQLAEDCLFNTISRLESFSGDSVPKLSVIRNCFFEMQDKLKIEFDCVIDLDATNPLRSQKHLLKSFELFQQLGINIFSVVPARKNPYFNQVENIAGTMMTCKSNREIISGREMAPVVYDMNASIYIYTKRIMMSITSLIVTDFAFEIYEMPGWAAFDIDDAFDFWIVEKIMEDLKNVVEKTDY